PSISSRPPVTCANEFRNSVRKAGSSGEVAASIAAKARAYSGDWGVAGVVINAKSRAKQASFIWGASAANGAVSMEPLTNGGSLILAQYTNSCRESRRAYT